jgi:deoxyribose-phosphate aldolase
MEINKYLDAAVLKPEFTRAEAIEAIKECIKFKTKTVCVRPCDIDLAVEMCKGTETEVSCVLAFPHGTAPKEVKAFEAKLYAEKGANEIDMVVNYGFIKSGKWDWVEEDIRAVAEVTNKAGVPLKTIFETCYLTEEEIEATTKIAIKAGADFVKTSTGFGTGGATREAVEVMIKASEGKIKVKPSGGIRNYETAKMYVDMGAHRLGTNYSSNEAIIRGSENRSADAY